ncbi:GNAT family N-acetyltransferase [Bacillus sp. FJAT-49736]|uniref:GNAT family N-acetyltransferase n=1 Tax=Bacillus sp. FJAT-49736 TaxID=2833582 RepID=UPI001BC95774|nr:GNAT family N-acetyltransferase [Bacillus sp. FJAT-49736]MBS4172817.1 GNAT family N-acetyltransferase [Bacillus sp. FJAT-49736]
MIIKKMHETDISVVAHFIAQINQEPNSHIGYCGTDKEEIEKYLMEELTDVSAWDSFITAWENNSLLGIIGFDADIESKSIEVWGPFIKETHWNIASLMWNELLILLPDEIDKVNLFPNKKNHHCLQFASEQNFQFLSEQTILKINRQENNKSPVLPELTLEYDKEFSTLHQEAFPSTYYTSEQILARRNEHRKVFITTEQGELSGYIYVEAEPEFGEASIEFFAVKEQFRGKGIGGKLLTTALQWLFRFETINSVTLCVNSKNEKAIRLYEKVGFEVMHELCFFSKKMN